MIQDIQLRVEPVVAANEAKVKQVAAIQGHLEIDRIKHFYIIKRSIDARQHKVMINLTVRCFVDEMPQTVRRYDPYIYGNVSGSKQAVVVGGGPAGCTAAIAAAPVKVAEIGLLRDQITRS